MCEGNIPPDSVVIVVEAARDASNPLLVRGAVRRGQCTVTLGGPDRPAEADELLDAAHKSEGRKLVAWNGAALRLWKKVLRSAGVESDDSGCVLIEELVRRVLPEVPQPAAPEDVAAALQLPPPDSESPASLARFASECLALLLDAVPAEHRNEPVAVSRWLGAGDPRPDFSRFGFGRDLLANLPVTAGVYIMRTRGGRVLYVGKAANVRRRVQSYFSSSALRSEKNRRLHEQLHSLEVVPARSEIEALLTEMRLIRRHRPIVNVQSNVHDAPAGFGRRDNLVLLVPEPSGLKATSYFLRHGVFAGTLRVRLGRPASARLTGRVRTVYFSRTNPAQRAQPWERELVFQWLARNRRKLNYVDVDDAGSCSEAIRQISDYLLDPDRLSRKVCYR